MKNVRQDRLSCKWPGHPGCRLEIPGGWHITIPEILVDPDAEGSYLQALISTGLNPTQAQKLLRDQMQNYFDQGFLKSVRQSVLWRLREYVKHNPTLVVPGRGKRTFNAKGFDPELAQSLHSLALGRKLGAARIERQVREVYAEMRRRASDS